MLGEFLSFFHRIFKSLACQQILVFCDFINQNGFSLTQIIPLGGVFFYFFRITPSYCAPKCQNVKIFAFCNFFFKCGKIHYFNLLKLIKVSNPSGLSQCFCGKHEMLTLAAITWPQILNWILRTYPLMDLVIDLWIRKQNIKLELYS